MKKKLSLLLDRTPELQTKYILEKLLEKIHKTYYVFNNKKKN